MTTMFKNKLLHILFIIGPLSCYLLFVLVLKILGLLSIQNLVYSVTIFIGWIVALSIVFIQLRKTREDNQILKREEIKKSLEINAFKEINKAVTNFSDILSTISTKYVMLPTDLRLHMQSPNIFKFDKMKMELEISDHRATIYKGVAEYVLSIEANEISVTRFDHLRKYIQFKVDDVADSIMSFQNYVANTNASELGPNKNSEFNKWCEKIVDELQAIMGYLFDYRIELMNYFLGDIFVSKVPRRKPKDPKCKILTEVATKEEIEKEAEMREKKALEYRQ